MKRHACGDKWINKMPQHIEVDTPITKEEYTELRRSNLT